MKDPHIFSEQGPAETLYTFTCIIAVMNVFSVNNNCKVSCR